MNKKLFALALALGLTASLAACGSSAPAASGSAGSASGSAAASTPSETVTLKVAASPTPHAEILNAVKGVLAEQGIDPVSYTHLDVYKRQMPSSSKAA